MEKILTIRLNPKELEMLDYVLRKYWNGGVLSSPSRSEVIRVLINFYHDEYDVIRKWRKEIKEKIESKDPEIFKKLEIAKSALKKEKV